MDVKEFIEIIASAVVESCNSANLLPSPTMAQAIIESKYGTSELATKANALFGIKANSSWNGEIYNKQTQEYINDSYTTVIATFRKYPSWDESIKDHTQFLLKKRYENLIGVRDYKTYCRLIKEDGYATSPIYTQTLINCIEKYNLTKYDSKIEEVQPEEGKQEKTLSFNIHAGHNPSGMVASGSIGYLVESDENRTVCNGLVSKIKEAGYTVYNCTCNDGTSQNDVLKKIVAKCNSNNVDYDISLHFNAYQKEFVRDGQTKGVEVWIHSGNKGKEIEMIATNVCNSIAELGFTNRGVKYSEGLYVLKNTKAPAMLIECCFVDDIDDYILYNPEKMINAIFKGLGLTEKTEEKKELYYVVVGVYSTENGANDLKQILNEKGYLMNEDGNLYKGIIANVKKIENS